MIVGERADSKFDRRGPAGLDPTLCRRRTPMIRTQVPLDQGAEDHAISDLGCKVLRRDKGFMPAIGSNYPDRPQQRR
jgi:hypothetical protein